MSVHSTANSPLRCATQEPLGGQPHLQSCGLIAEVAPGPEQLERALVNVLHLLFRVKEAGQ